MPLVEQVVVNPDGTIALYHSAVLPPNPPPEPPAPPPQLQVSDDFWASVLTASRAVRQRPPLVTSQPHQDLAVATGVNKMLVIFGQSNGLGLCTAANVTVYSGLTDAYPAVQMYDHDATSFNNPPSFQNDGPRDLSPRTNVISGGYVAGMGGVELVEARELDINTPDSWFVLKMCIDGSSLVTGWNSSSYPTGGPQILTQLTDLITTWASTWNVTDFANNLVLQFMQGEADTGQAYATYKSNLDGMVSTLRGTLGNCWFVMNRLTSKADTFGNVRAAEEAFFADDAKTVMAYGDDLALRDAVHYTDDSFATLGGRLSVAIVPRLYGGTQPTPRFVAGAPFITATSGSGITLTLPPHQTDDVLLVVLSALGNNNYSLSDAQGFAEVSASPIHDSGSTLNARCQAWWRRMPGSGQTAPTIGDVASDDSKVATVLLFRGCATSGNPWDAIAGGTAATSTSVSFPSITTTVDGCLVVNIGCIRVDSGTPQFGAFTNADLTGLTPHMNFSTAAGLGYGIGVCVGYRVGHGSVASTTSTLATTSTQALLTIAFKP